MASNDFVEHQNPYFERGPIRDPDMFFGRTVELDFIFSRLTGMQSVSIVGERRIGKSSLLLEVQRSGSTRLGEEYRFVYLDAQGVTTMAEFYGKLLRQLGHVGASHSDLEKAIQDCKLVACLDEFEKVCGNRAFTKDFFDVLRSLAQTHHLALVVGSQRSLVELQKAGGIASSPFYNIFTTWTMGDLTPHEARELASKPAERAGIPFIDCEIDFALETAGLHPYRLTVLCYHLFETKRDGSNDLEGARDEYERELALHGGHAYEAELETHSANVGGREHEWTFAATPSKGIGGQRLASGLIALSALGGFLALVSRNALLFVMSFVAFLVALVVLALIAVKVRGP
jgi:hypothetical protein